MSLPPLRLSHSFDSYISGEVIIHPSAVLAPGVILQAAPNSKIIIGSGVCIGMGAILQVHEGTLEIETGANLGAGFLMVGNGTIGANACIGAATTVFNCSVAPGQVIAPGSVLGDMSRKLSAVDTATNVAQKAQPSTDGSTFANVEAENLNISQAEQEREEQPISTPLPDNSTPSSSDQPTQEAKLSLQDSQESSTEAPNTFGTLIYGQGNIQRLLVTLFPHRQPLNESMSDD